MREVTTLTVQIAKWGNSQGIRLSRQMLEDVLEEPAHNEKEYLLEKYI